MVQVTVDGFLGGQLRLAQPKTGYRAGIDPVLLAAACPAQSGQEVLELGCGVGVASLCLGRRVPGLALNGVEILGEYAQIARENAARNDIEFDVRQGDVSARPTPFFDRSFHHVIMNPPYFAAGASSISPEAGRASGRSEQVALSHWVDMAAKRLRPKGYLTVIQRAERLPDLLAALEVCLGSIVVQPLAPRAGRPAHLILLRARKSGRAAFQLLSAQSLHSGDEHIQGQPDYVPEVSAILRDGVAFSWRN
ncbi:methyltransferase [Planktomarina temperata]|nr:methyltransferase [Planktomarina temperata]